MSVGQQCTTSVSSDLRTIYTDGATELHTQVALQALMLLPTQVTIYMGYMGRAMLLNYAGGSPVAFF